MSHKAGKSIITLELNITHPSHKMLSENKTNKIVSFFITI